MRNNRRAATVHGGQARRTPSNAVIAANCKAKRLLLGRHTNICLHLPRYLMYLKVLGNLSIPLWPSSDFFIVVEAA